MLALAPLVQAGLVTGDIIIDAKSGVSGAGKAPSERTHFCEVDESLSAYGVFAHRHAAEIEQELGVAVTFVPHLVPLDRGILETIYVRVPAGTTEGDIAAVYERAYKPARRSSGCAAARCRSSSTWRTRTSATSAGSWMRPPGRLVVVSCIDNLLKGAAGQAVQNFNVAFGFDERTGPALMAGVVLLKLGGELLEQPAGLAAIAAAHRVGDRDRWSSSTAAAREIDAALARAGVAEAAGGRPARHRRRPR